MKSLLIKYKRTGARVAIEVINQDNSKIFGNEAKIGKIRNLVNGTFFITSVRVPEIRSAGLFIKGTSTDRTKTSHIFESTEEARRWVELAKRAVREINVATLKWGIYE